jgi:uncharacterized protein (DUF433 family)
MTSGLSRYFNVKEGAAGDLTYRWVAPATGYWSRTYEPRLVEPAGRGRYSAGMAFERITVDPARMRGLPCIRDSRVTVSAVLGQLAAGRSVDQVLEDYPYLEREDVLAALEYAAAAAQERELPLIPSG